jgi:hypothetical protein
MTTLPTPARQRDTAAQQAPRLHAVEDAAALRDRLAALRAIGPVPPVVEPARLARPGEVPAAAAGLLKAADESWRGRAFYALGPVPYTWNLRAAGYRFVASLSVRLRHLDGRAAVGVWVTDSVTSSVGAKVPKGHEGPRRPPVWGQTWAWAYGWTWQVCTCDARLGEHPANIPEPIGAAELRAHVAPAEAELALEVAA